MEGERQRERRGEEDEGRGGNIPRNKETRMLVTLIGSGHITDIY